MGQLHLLWLWDIPHMCVRSFCTCIRMFINGFSQSGESDGIETRERESHMFPDEGKDENVLSMALTQDFLIYTTQVHWP